MWDWGRLVWDVRHRMYDVHCKYAGDVRCFPFLLAYVLLMHGVWVKSDVEGAEWSFQKSVWAAARYLRVQSVKITPKLAGRPSTMVPATVGVSLPS